MVVSDKDCKAIGQAQLKLNEVVHYPSNKLHGSVLLHSLKSSTASAASSSSVKPPTVIGSLDYWFKLHTAATNRIQEWLDHREEVERALETAAEAAESSKNLLSGVDLMQGEQRQIQLPKGQEKLVGRKKAKPLPEPTPPPKVMVASKQQKERPKPKPKAKQQLEPEVVQPDSDHEEDEQPQPQQQPPAVEVVQSEEASEDPASSATTTHGGETSTTTTSSSVPEANKTKDPAANKKTKLRRQEARKETASPKVSKVGSLPPIKGVSEATTEKQPKQVAPVAKPRGQIKVGGEDNATEAEKAATKSEDQEPPKKKSEWDDDEDESTDETSGDSDDVEVKPLDKKPAEAKEPLPQKVSVVIEPPAQPKVIQSKPANPDVVADNDDEEDTEEESEEESSEEESETEESDEVKRHGFFGFYFFCEIVLSRTTMSPQRGSRASRKPASPRQPEQKMRRRILPRTSLRHR